uniref:Putative DNA repair protein UVH3 isoform X1 n=1 Tax=Davidia involucrata TaxID=16924 RepID=A0A5B6YV96_DAVIN
MGVHGLWQLLAPVGRRVSVETLAGKKLAIDASIWMIQFMKAMRDDKGEMVRNAHLLGFFRRICKLLFLRTKPVFVFDGGTPALKRRTVIARRRQRENAQAKIRKTAEKLLLNHLKALKLKELANDLEDQRLKNDAKGKKVVTDQLDMKGNNLEENDTVSGSYNQEALDEMLAASLAAEEDGSFTGNASTSGAGIPTEEEDGDEDEEMILPTMHGKVDPAVLAALPPSMQLDLLVQMRERLMAENRQKYQKVKQAPAKFSELQIQSYLKTVAFRREIDEVQRSAAGSGVGGVQTKRIASEANREFIFSSSFTGDKQVLTSAGVERNGDKQQQTPTDHPSSDSLHSIASSNKSNAATGSIMDEPRREFHDDVETYLDERGRFRVSRVRAMGIRMTRDLQRNLDLMKEIEQKKTNANKITNNESIPNNNIVGASRRFPNKIQYLETSHLGNDGTVCLNDTSEPSVSKNEISVEISFEDDGEQKCLDGDDDLFARLAAGDPVMISSAENTSSKNQSFDSASDCDWEEGVIEEKGDGGTQDVKVENKRSLAEGGISDESEVEWEEGLSDVTARASPCPAEFRETVSKGVLEEEADFQEAIKRSLEDLRGQNSIDATSEDEKLKEAREMAHEVTGVMTYRQENDRAEANMPLQNVQQPNESSYEIVSGVERPDRVRRSNMLKTNDSSVRQLEPSITVNPDNVDILIDKQCERYPNPHLELLRQDASGSGNLQREIGHMEPITPVKEKGVHDTFNDGGQMSTCANSSSGVSSRISDLVLGDVPNVILTDAKQNDFESAPNNHSNETTEQKESFVNESRTEIDAVQKLAEEKNHSNCTNERDDSMDKSAFKDNKEQLEVTDVSLEEEMLILGKERRDLGEEQRKLERNVDSVSSEMFAECQELLQMFGLPYIIAPMEAEAQCAYMELANLVDGVVTDDSDAFLFGARSVYKNIFDDRKYVETYFMKDIENELGLTREKLIRMALLLGSDYTEGVSGIGIVNAIEVVNAFPEQDGLQKFREWIESPDPTILGKFNVQTGSSSRKRGSKVSNDVVGCSNSDVEGLSTADQDVSESVDYIQNIKQIFMDKHRNVSKNWHISSSFPSEAVISAYASPQVDDSTEPFSWGKPDLFVLHKLCWEKFGWGSQKADELLLPVLKEYNKHETQLRLEAFYTFNERFAKIRSKRIKKAVKGITGNKSLELMDESVQEVSKSRKKRRVSPSEPGDDKLGKPLSGTESGVAKDESNFMEKSTAKRSRKKTLVEPAPSEAGNPEPPMQTEGKRNTNTGSSARGQGKGKGRGQAVGRGRRKENPSFEYAEISSNDEINSDGEWEVQVEKLERSHEIRRSTRLRRAVKYTENNVEIVEPGKSDQNDENCADEEAVEEEHFWDQGVVGDASTGPSEKNTHKVGDPSHEGLCRDYLEMGGEFCMDEAEPEIETGQLGTGQVSGRSFEAEFSKEYLKMGGGFCLDEDEIDKDPDKCASDAARITIFENADPSHCSGFVEEADDDIGPVHLVSSPIKALDGLQNGGRPDASDSKRNLDRSNATTDDDQTNVATFPPDYIKEDDSRTIPIGILSAMPYLRRKRRKS